MQRDTTISIKKYKLILIFYACIHSIYTRAYNILNNFESKDIWEDKIEEKKIVEQLF
jgi:hypothetical protein